MIIENMTINRISRSFTGLWNPKSLIKNGTAKYPDKDSMWPLNPDWQPRGVFGRLVPSDAAATPKSATAKKIASQAFDNLNFG